MERPGITTPTTQPAAGWRVKVGAAMFALSILLPVAGIPLVANLDVSGKAVASISGVLLAGAEVLGLVAVAVMGKPGYAHVKSLFLRLLRHVGPPREVSRIRYQVGLIMFSIPILFGWVAPYVSDWVNLGDKLIAYAIAGDVLLLTSLFVLGGDFWDKLRSLFVHDAKVFQSGAAEIPG